MEYILNHKDTENADFVVRAIIGSSRYNPMFKTDLLSTNSDNFVNRYYARILGVKSIRTSPEPSIVGMNDNILVSE